jgi:Mrp family chromosome partitioning ATPase
MADKVREKLKSVGRTLLVLSGKGGVGKSTVASGLALSLAAQGKRVGLLDVDICGPSVPTLLGLRGSEIVQTADGWVPVPVPLPPAAAEGAAGGAAEGTAAAAGGSLAVMSIGFLLHGADDPVIWRGPKKNAMIRQFLSDVAWGQLDYLVIDTPPGTSDEHMSLVEYINAANVAGDGCSDIVYRTIL